MPERARRVADQIGMNSHVVYVDGMPRVVRAMDIALSEDQITIFGRTYRMDAVRDPSRSMYIDACTLDDVRDYHTLLKCAEKGIMPQPDVLEGFLNKEALAEANRLFHSQ